MHNLSSSLKTLKNGANHPGALKSVLAGLAIAWGSRTAMRVAEDATGRTLDAVAYLDELKAEIENAHAELVLIGDQFTERVSEHIRDGIMDGAVKARAAAMGWTPELFPPFIAHPATDDETVKAAYSVENMHREPYPDTAGD